ncbi:6960_t:CDS:2, partial [Rhizophagus irregularis]
NNETNSSIPIDNKNNETNSSIPIDNKNNETNSPIPIDDKNNETKLSPPNSPIDPKKVLAAPTTYINTTIAKPIITEPPKSVLSPRLQDYINNYNKATMGVDKN